MLSAEVESACIKSLQFQARMFLFLCSRNKIPKSVVVKDLKIDNLSTQHGTQH